MTRPALVAVILLAVAAPSAWAAPPVATTGVAHTPAPSSATVAGTVDPGGVATTYRVEYGTTAAYGAPTAAASAGAGTASVPTSATLTGLTRATTYHYRFVASNADGTSTGADATFTTAAGARPSARTLSTSAVTPTGASRG